MRSTTAPEPRPRVPDPPAGRAPGAALRAEPARYAFLRCWCADLTGRPLAQCRDCGGGGMALVRFPAPAAG